MIRVGCYNWFHDRTDPDVINNIFQACDVVLLQRFPEVLCEAFGNSEYRTNWKQHGMLSKGADSIQYHELPDNAVSPNQSQGKFIPILSIGDIKIINCLPSYDHPGATEQLDYIMSLIDDNTVLAGDMHWEDSNINSLYIKHQLINHMHMKTFTGQRGQRLSLDKILTRGGITIDDIVVHDELATNNIEHYPYEFTIHDK
jgi:hypothetical protein